MNVHLAPSDYSTALSPLGEAALGYAERGWHVFPCRPDRKEPAGGHGHKDATSDPQKVREWWSRSPSANIGINLAASGLVAVDADLYKPECGWTNLVGDHEVPDTLVQSSPSGGRHFIFTAEPGERFDGEAAKFVDLKHDGYILLEPSTFGGRPYRFDTDDDPAPCPEWVPRKAPKSAPPLSRANKDNVERLAELLSGMAAHDNSRDLVASLVAQGVPTKAVEEFVTAAILAGVEPGQRRNDRLARVPYHVASALMKFAPDQAPERRSQFYSAATLAGKPVPLREWLVPALARCSAISTDNRSPH